MSEFLFMPEGINQIHQVPECVCSLCIGMCEWSITPILVLHPRAIGRRMGRLAGLLQRIKEVADCPGRVREFSLTFLP